VKYACIARHVGHYPLRLMCRVLDVSPSGFHAWHKRQPAARAIADALLQVEIAAIHRASRQRYGSPRVHQELRHGRGIRCGKKRVARLMRRSGLRGKRPRRFRVTTQSQHPHPIAPNVLNRDFAVAQPNRVWGADITYIPTGEGWLYLAVLLDLASRRAVGWALEPTLERDLVLTALQQALTQRQPTAGLLHHSDRGSQYACGEYRERLAERGIAVSMSRKGDCWDNAVVESFFATLKTELVHDARWPTRAAAKQAIAEFIEVWYNRQRRHSSLGYLSPAEYELKQMRHAA
jgi:transposase InsO family protein